MIYSELEINRIYDRTCGYCHLCHGKLAFSNYNQFGKRGAWEVEHSKPNVYGGTYHMNNLYPAHISRNRSKGKHSTKRVRASFGVSRAPYTRKKKQQIKSENQLWVSMVCGIIGGRSNGLAGAVFGVGIGILIGEMVSPEI